MWGDLTELSQDEASRLIHVHVGLEVALEEGRGEEEGWGFISTRAFEDLGKESQYQLLRRIMHYPSSSSIGNA